jgi:hypothetical protein
MQVSEKEQIYTQLREYHEMDKQFRTSDAGVINLQTELEGIKEETVNSVLRFVNGKSEFSDVQEPLQNLKTKYLEPNPVAPRTAIINHLS